MRAITTKLFRDLNRLKGQVITIALVVACGIASFVTMRSAYDSLLYSRDEYYERYRFGDIFAHLELAPEALKSRIAQIPGIAQVHTRLVEPAMVPMPNMARPASATLVSLPSQGQVPLNAVHLVQGRMVDPTRSDEVVVLEAFAAAHDLELADRIPVVINGVLRPLRIVGIGMSPEFVLTIPAGGITYDPARIAILWLDRHVIEAAFDEDGGFNDVVAKLQPGASEVAVLDRLDQLLEPYGGRGALGRAKQPSHYMLDGELQQLETLANVVPFIFLFVAAFLLNVVLARLVILQRAQIAMLKAVGYRDRDIGWHYLQLVSVIVVLGAIVGIGVGAYLGEAMTGLYTGEFFRFPEPRYRLDWEVAATGVGVSLAAAVVGALATVRHVVRLPPAEAMRPPDPGNYRRTLLERVGLFRWLSPAARMILREVQRRPLRVVLSALGISMAIGIVVVSRYMFDAMEYMMNVQVHRAMREDLTVTFVKPLPDRAISELEHIPGVFRAEGLRSAPVRIRSGHRWRDVALQGHHQPANLRRLVDGMGIEHQVSPDGVVLTSKLAQVLEVAPGDMVEVDLREGSWESLWLPVVGLVEEAFGMQGHMPKEGLHRVLGETSVANVALLAIDMAWLDSVSNQLKQMPWVLGVSSPRDFREKFEEQSGEMIGIYTLILTVFASIIAVGVIYNNTRVALSQRSRDLASLRVLGFKKAEIAAMLFGEQAVQVVIAIPIGLVIGHAMVIGIASTADPETYRLPIVVSARTYLYACMVAVGSAIVSALLVHRKLQHLDLIEVLKTRE